MEKTYLDSGITTEQFKAIVLDTVYEVMYRINIPDIMLCVKAKHPEITEEQWETIGYTIDDAPDIQDREAFDKLVAELGVENLLTDVCAADEDDSGDESEKLEE